MTSPESAPARRFRLSELTNRIVSASASIIAIAALGTAVYEARLMRQQAKASVWPYLIQGNSSNHGYSRIVQNVGLGPALIRAFEVRVDGKPMQYWQQVGEALGLKLSRRGSMSTTFQPGFVVPTGAEINLFTLPDPNDVALFRSRLDHLETWVCYCSLYDDCWTATDTGGQGVVSAPTPVNACKDDPARRFRE